MLQVQMKDWKFEVKMEKKNDKMKSYKEKEQKKRGQKKVQLQEALKT